MASELAERRQRQDLSIRWILAAGLGTLGLVGVTLCLVLLFERFSGTTTPVAQPPGTFPPPRLQSDPAGELRDYLASQRAALDGYGWVNREAGLVRIPVTRAMEMIVARGTDAYAPLDPPEPVR